MLQSLSLHSLAFASLAVAAVVKACCGVAGTGQPSAGVPMMGRRGSMQREYAGRSDVRDGFAAARPVSGFWARCSAAISQTGILWRAARTKVETRDVRAALTEGLFKVTLMFRVDRGLQRATRESRKVELGLERGKTVEKVQ
jgi:hypothetical protein